MNYRFRTGPFQHDDDAVALNAGSIGDVIEYVGKMDPTLEYLNHAVIQDSTIVRFSSPSWPIYKTEPGTFFDFYQESIRS